MTTAVLRAAPPALARLQALVVSRWAWCVLAAAFVVFRDAQSGPGLTLTLGDTDDATRLVQVRAFLAGAGWYDLALPVFGGPNPLVSHWSRLIDLPIALLMVLFGSVLAADQAEVLARAAWPTLLLVGFFRLNVREAEARGGETAGWIALCFAATCLSGLFQFKIGRIDHHNAMILCTVIGALVLARASTSPALSREAGVWFGLALVVGYEPLAFIVPLAALAALAAVIHTPWLGVARHAATAFAVTLAAGLVLTTPVWRWGVSVCDALSFNLVLAAAVGALGLRFIGRNASSLSVAVRLGWLAATGAVASAAYLAANPVCLGGPFAAVDPEVHRVWLSKVRETQPLWQLYAGSTAPIVIFVGFVLAGVMAAIRRAIQDRSTEATATLLVLLALVPPALLQSKFIPYASFLAAFALALSVARFSGGGQLTPLSAKLIGVVALNQNSLSLFAGLLLTLAGPAKAAVDGKTLPPVAGCKRADTVAALGKLPRGLIVSGIDLGSYIAATTPHRVYAAPYHRLDQAIRTTHRLFAGDASHAAEVLRSLGASYVVECLSTAGLEDPFLPSWATDESLYTHLARGTPPPFLVEIPNATPVAELRVWRVHVP